MKKIILVCYIPLTTEFENNFYVKEFLENGFEVEYWDVTEIYFKDIKFGDAISRDYGRKIRNFNDLEKMVKAEDIKNTVFIPVITFDYKIEKLFKFLSRAGCKMLFFARGMLPSARGGNISFNDILRKIRGADIYKIRSSVLNRLDAMSGRPSFSKYYDTVFTAGSAAKKLYLHCPRTVAVNHFDYDNFLITRDSSRRCVKGDYCLYLDDGLVDANDFKMFNIDTIDADRYYKAMDIFFVKLEKKYGLKVVIAEHPKAKHKKNAFGGREIYKGLTSELVKNCVFAIAHYSTSVSYAVLHNKPVIFIYTGEMRKQGYFKNITGFAASLNSDLYNIDSLGSGDNIEIKSVDRDKYEAYKYFYLTSKESENMLTPEIVTRYLKNFERIS